MLIAVVVGICVLLAVLGFLVPARLLSKSFGKSQSAADKSHSAGKKARSKAPF